MKNSKENESKSNKMLSMGVHIAHRITEVKIHICLQCSLASYSNEPTKENILSLNYFMRELPFKPFDICV